MSIQVSSNPHAFLRPIYRRIADGHTFRLLSESHQFNLLVEAVSGVSEHHARLLRDYSPAAKIALLSHLANAESLRPGEGQVELWRVQKGDRVLSCIALYLPTGVDVRVFENDDLRRTQLVKDGPLAEDLAFAWRHKAECNGWTQSDRQQPT